MAAPGARRNACGRIDSLKSWRACLAFALMGRRIGKGLFMATPALRGRVGPGAIVALCFVVAALEGYDIQAFGIAAPRLPPALHLGPSQVGWAGSAAMLGLMLGAFVGGGLADRIGRKPVLVASVAAFGLFSIVTALTHTYETLALARFLTGLGFGGAMPNLIAVAGEISSANRRAATTTSMFCGIPAGGSAVALLAQLGGASLDWRTLFLIGGALPLLVAPLIALLLPETRPQPDPSADRRLVHTLAGEGRGLATLLLWLLIGLDLLVTYLMVNWLPTLTVARGFSPVVGATASLWFNGFSVVGALVLGRVADRIGYAVPAVLTFVGLAAGLYGLASTQALPSLLGFAAVSGFFVVGGAYVIYALAPLYYPPQARAIGAGAAIGVGRLGSIAGPAIAGQLRAAGQTPAQVLQAMIPVALLGAATALILVLTRKPRTD